MIPDILWQSWKTKDVPKSVKRQADSWNTSNPQLQKRFMDDAECSSFILEHFGKSVHELYLQLPQPIMRADFWRVAVVYIHGGYYSDLDITCNVILGDLIPNTPSAVFTQELDNISNFFFGAEPKHPVLKLAIDKMIYEARRIIDKETQSFGMHSLHSAVREYYNVIGTKYENNENVYFIKNEQVKSQGKFIHSSASLTNNSDEYISWRSSVKYMIQEREKSNDILFFTTFNRNGYELYGKEWVKSFTALANYYNKFHAKIFYEGFVSPKDTHPNIQWVKYEDVIRDHLKWKEDYLNTTQHSDYVRTMTVRFSHKAFVIQHVLDTESHDYLIWVDGDCVFKNADYGDFPKALLGDRFLACQVEHAHDLNHVESGLLIFKGGHPDTKRFNEDFKKWYRVENILPMGQPYDGFLVFKSLLTTGVKYVDLNKEIGGGIQSDPSMTFRHPKIRSKFIHNIGWTGKKQYANWESVYRRDEIYQKMKGVLFGFNNDIELNKKKENARNKLLLLKKIRSKNS